MKSGNNWSALARGFCACEPSAKIYIFNAAMTNWAELKMRCDLCSEKIRLCKLENDMVVDCTENHATWNRA
jgi:hypothetical protein